MKQRKIGFVFAGQGSQYVGMGLDFYNEFDEVKEIYDHPSIKNNLKDICFYGPEEALNDTANTQPSILLTSLAIARVLNNYHIHADMVAGLSLGEYTALTYVQSLSLSDSLYLVQKRGEIMADALASVDSTMFAVIGLDVDSLQSICHEASTLGVCEIASHNYPGQLVITGHRKALLKARELCMNHKAKRVIFLNVSGAFHSSLLEEASIKLKRILTNIPINKPSVPVVFNATGKVETNSILELLVKQIKSTVYFQQSIEHMIDSGITCFIEIGPKKTLTGFIKQINSSLETYNISSVKDLEFLLKTW